MTERIPLIKKLEQVAERIPGVTFMYDDWNTLNVRANALRKPCEQNASPEKEIFTFDGFPLLFVLLQSTGTLRRRFTSNMRDAGNFLIGVVVPMDSKEYDFDGMNNVVRVEWAKSILTQFLNLYEGSGMFRPLPDDIPYFDVYKLFDSRTTGVYVNVLVDEQVGNCLPTLPEYPLEPIDPTQWYRDCLDCPPIMKPV